MAKGVRRVAVLAAVLAVAGAGGCFFNNKLQPLAGEDPKALAIAGERQEWLLRTGASRAFDELRKAALAKDRETMFALLGPATRAALKTQAEKAHVAPETLLDGRAEGLGLAGAPDPLAALSAPGDAVAKEADPFDPARRAVRLKVRIGTNAEFMLPAVYTESGWRFELVRKDATPA